MNIEEENYQLDYDEEKQFIIIEGSLRLNGLNEYQPIHDVLAQALNSADSMTVDLSKLEFLNSSGIAMFSKFMIEARGKAEVNIKFLGSSAIPWHTKSFTNLQRLFPKLQVEII